MVYKACPQSRNSNNPTPATFASPTIPIHTGFPLIARQQCAFDGQKHTSPTALMLRGYSQAKSGSKTAIKGPAEVACSIFTVGYLSLANTVATITLKNIRTETRANPVDGAGPTPCADSELNRAGAQLHHHPGYRDSQLLLPTLDVFWFSTVLPRV